MKPEIEKAEGIGFCFGVRRALGILERAAREHGGIEALGAVVHNRQVLQRLAVIGVRIAAGVNDIHGSVVAIGAHGAGPQLEKDLRARGLTVVNTTCPFVLRAQKVAQRLSRTGFLVLIYGDAGHPEVRGILGWADDEGLATLDASTLSGFRPLPRRIGVLAQTTQIPAHFVHFTREVVGTVLGKDSDLRIIDTICHDIRRRQAAAMEVAGRVDLMLVVGDHTSANTNRLAELCAAVTSTRLIETADEIYPGLVEGYRRIGVTGGASTAERTINEVLAKLEAVTGQS